MRYTLFAPLHGAAEARLWAAVFERSRPPVSARSILPIQAFRARGDQVQIGDSSLGLGVCQGQAGPITWHLYYQGQARPARREPVILHRLPLPTQVRHTHAQATFSGTVQVGDRTLRVERQSGTQKHLWGHRRVEELCWIYAPDVGPNGFEATAVRARRRAWSPALTCAWLGDEANLTTLPWALLGRTRCPDRYALHLETASWRRRVVARAEAEAEQLVGYRYRDPAGHDLYVAQSDLARCEVELYRRDVPWQSWGPATVYQTEMAALEFHGLEPLAGVEYWDWD